MWNKKLTMNKNIKLQPYRLLERESGNILITVLLMIGIFSGLLHSVLQINIVRNTTQRTTQQIDLAENIKQQIYYLLQNPYACELNLKGKNQDSSLTELSSGTDTNPRVFKVGDVYTYSNHLGLSTTETPTTGLIKLGKITLDSLSEGQAKLRIVFNKIEPTIGSPITQKTIDLQAQTSFGKIEICKAGHSISQVQFCQTALLGTPNSEEKCRDLSLQGHVTSGPLNTEIEFQVNKNMIINGDVILNGGGQSQQSQVTGSVKQATSINADIAIARQSYTAPQVGAHKLCYDAGDGSGCSTCIERWPEASCGDQRMVSISVDGTILCEPWN